MSITGARLRRRGAWLLLVLGGSLSPVAHAGAGVWTSGGPYSGEDVFALAINPKAPTTLYAAIGGGVFRSTDSGASWAAANAGLEGLVNALAIDPSNPTTLYAGTTGPTLTDGGVFKSTDSGGTWVAANTGLPNLRVLALAIDPSAPATIYAGTSVGGIFKSTDSGGSWAAANAGLTNLSVRALALDPAAPTTVYAGTYGGVFKSTDSGGTWVAANAGLANSVVLALAINPLTPATLYAGSYPGGVFKSTDSGGTWTPTNTGLMDSQYVYALAINPVTPSTVYAATAGSGVYKSTDSGGTWAAANAGQSNLSTTVLAINPATPATLYTGTAGGRRGGVFKSKDAGRTWAASNSGLGPPVLFVSTLAIDPAIPSMLYAGALGAEGIFKSTDSGATWAAANEGLTDWTINALAISSSSPSTLYAGTDGGVFKSMDSAGTWTAMSSGLPTLKIVALAVVPVAPATLYAATPRGVFKSTNSGGTWAAANSGLGVLSVSALAINPSNPATLYAATNLGGVFKSTNSGGTWVAANTGLGVTWVFAVAIDPVTPATLYAGTSGGGVFKSTDSGGTWTAANAGLPNVLNVYALAINPSAPATLYAGTDAGVFRSTDSGGTWAAANTGLTNPSVVSLALDPTGATTLYAGFANGGAWQSTPATLSFTGLLPTSAHSTGLGGAFYTTNVSVSNAGGSNALFTLKFLGNNKDGSNGSERRFNLDPGQSTTFLDVLGSVFNETSGFGAIRITSNTSTLDIVSVTSTPGFGGTFGQAMPAIFFADLIPAGSARSILYVREGDGFRSNLVLASSAFDSTNVDVALISPAGSILATKTYSVPPNGMTQINRVVRDLGVSGPVTGARLVLSSINPRAAFTALASVIDETTNDPIAVPAQPDSVVGLAPFTWLLPSTAHSSGLGGAFYTTNVAVANVGVAPASFTMKFLGNNRDGSAGPEQTFNLEAGKSVTYFDVLGSIFNQTSNFGALRITSSTSSLNVVSVTSTPGFGGTFGQSSPALSSPDLIPAGSSRSILSIREGDGFRTNLILASNANVSTTIDVALVSPGGATLATKSYSVPRYGMTQVNRVTRDMGVLSPITGARLVLSSTTPNASFTAFASVIDEVTNDPSAVQPQ